ncbi:MAG: DUF4401 domain-containing protein [Thermodesulfobacteriota bacterium]
MVRPAPTLGELVDQPRVEGLLDEIGARNAAARLAGPGRAGDPFYIRLLAALGAWAAAACFTSFLHLARLVDLEGTEPLLWSLLFLVPAVVIRRLSRRTFLVQLTLAFCTAGHLLLLWWAAHWSGDNAVTVLRSLTVAQAAATALMYWPYRDRTYRFLAPLAALVLLAVWLAAAGTDLGRETGRLHLLEAVIVLEAAAGGWLLARRPSGDFVRPVGYAAAVAAPGALLLLILWPRAVPPGRPVSLALALGLSILYLWAAGGSDRLKTEGMLTAVAATLALGLITNPGLLAAVGLLVLGYAQGDKALLGLGCLFLPLFLAVYYYDLDVTLAYKSWVLAGSGLLLLLARFVAGRRPWAKEARE